MKTEEERLKEWAGNLTDEQAKAALCEIVYEAMQTDVVHFFNDALVPYWEATGEPLVAGQKTFEDDG